MLIRKRYFVLIFLFTAVLFAGTEKKAMNFIDMLNIPSVSSVNLSNDGKMVVYVLSETDWNKNRQISHIWKVNSDGSNNVKLTNGDTGERSPVWSPDDTRIAFLSKRGNDKVSQIYVINVNGGEAKRISSHESSVSSIKWSKCGKYIYFLANDCYTKEEIKRKKLKDDVKCFENDYKQRHLWKVAVDTGEEIKITKGDFSVGRYSLSYDGSMIALRIADSPVREEMDKSEVWVMNSDGSNMKRITKNNFSESGERISPDNKKVLFLASANEDFEYYYNSNLFVVSIDGEKIKMLIKDFPYEIQQAEWSDKGSYIFIKANMGVHTEIFKVRCRDEKIVQITNGKHSVNSLDLQVNIGKAAFSEATNYNAGDICIVNLKERARPFKVTHVFDYINKNYYLPKVEEVHWKSSDGTEVEGLLYYPIDYKEGQKYALNVQTHGGPRSSDKYGPWRWRTYIPVITARGYFVFQPNYRGSTGYGDKFLRDMVGHYYQNAHIDVMTGVDFLIKRGLVDSTQMVKSGWSAGGHMTNKIITYTNRFKAASSGAGAVNWISMYAQSDTRAQRTSWFGGTPWQKDAPIDIYWNNSPLKDIWKVSTPTIIFVGEEDVRVPPPQSVELYRALRSNGVPVKLYMAPREPHGWGELHHRLFKMNSEFEWFEKYARNRDFIWEKAPEK